MAATLQWRLTGGASNSDPNASLGGVRSSQSLSATALNNLFDDVAPAEASAGDTEYRALDLYNYGDATASLITFWWSTETSSSATTVHNAIEASPINSTTSIANESTQPAGTSFLGYNSGSKLTLPDIPAGSGCRVWFKRIVTAGALNTTNDSGAFVAEYA